MEVVGVEDENKVVHFFAFGWANGKVKPDHKDSDPKDFWVSFEMNLH